VLPRRIFLLLLVPLVLVVGGTVGYYVLEPRYTLFDALYMTVITLTTVGYEEIHHPLSTGGRLFTIFLLLGGVFTLFYTAAEILRVVVSGEVQDLLGRKRMRRSLAGMRQHMIICGFGRMGRFVCHEFSKQGLPFVVVDRNAQSLAGFDLAHGVPLQGDATSDEVLRQAGVDRARALVTVVASDADNLYITLSARLLSDQLFIVARAEGDLAEQKLLRAGANRVVSPYAIGGFKVAQAVLRPTVVDFIELATRTEHLELQIEETRLLPASNLVGATLTASRLRQDLGLIIVAIKKADGRMIYTPPGDAVMEAGDTLIALGRRPQLDELEVLAGGKG
jgi:voltage-gated potassium channel